MLTGKLTPASSSADWVSDEFIARDEFGSDVDLTGLQIELEVRSRHSEILLKGSTETGEITISTSRFQWSFPESLMRGIPADRHDVYIRIKDPGSSEIEQIAVADIDIYEGGFR